MQIDDQLTEDSNIIITSQMQQQSKTEQLINRNNFRKHKQKLNEIKRNDHNTSLQFYSSTKARPLDRKKIMMLKLKKQQIQQENEHLRRKIQKINHSTAYDNWRSNKRKPQSEHESRKASHSVNYNIGPKKSERYDQNENEDQNVIGVFSQCNDGQSLKCFVPSAKLKIKYKSIAANKISDYNAIIFNLREKQNKQSNSLNKQPQKSESQNDSIIKQNPQGNQVKDNVNSLGKDQNPSITLFDTNPKLRQLIKQSSIHVNINADEALFNQPERQAHRLVLLKKTKIFYPMTSFLIQISLIQNRLLIIAYGMGLNPQDYRLLTSRKRTKALIEQIGGNYQILWNKVEVDIGGIRIDGSPNQNMLKYGNVILEQDENQKQKTEQQKKYEITQDFLQRNYYAVLKESINTKAKQREQKNIQQASTNQNGQIQLEQKQRKDKNSTQKSRPKSIFRNRIQYHREKAEQELSKAQQQENQSQIKKQNQVEQKKKIPGVVRVSEKQFTQNYIKNEKKKPQIKTKQEPKKKDSIQKQQKKPQTKITGKQSETKNQVKKQIQKEELVEQYGDQFEQKQNLSEDYEQQILGDEQNKQQQIEDEKSYKKESKIQEQSKQDRQAQKLANKMILKSSVTKNPKQKQVEDYEQSFQPENVVPDEDYQMQYQSNPSRVIKDNTSTRAVKKKTINNKSIVDSVIEDQIEQEVPKKTANRKKKDERDEVQQYLDEEFDS